MADTEIDQEDLDQDQELLGQDFREPAPPPVASAAPQPVPQRAPIQAPPPVAPAIAPPVAAPGAVPVRSPFLTPEEAEDQAAMRRAQYAIQDLPIDQAEKALTSALKFQAIRGYQRDLAAGKSAADALSRWAPIMFSQPKAGTLGQAAAMVRASRPAQPKVMNVGGVAYEIGPGRATALTPPAPKILSVGGTAYEFGPGGARQLTPAKVTSPRANQFDLQQHASLMRQIQAIEKDLATTPVEDRGDMIREIRRLQSQAEQIRSRSGSAEPKNEVIRLTKTNRRAVFDANTKKFLRYADQ